MADDTGMYEAKNREILVEVSGRRVRQLELEADQ